jgi:HSP20 family molecular chaperone IbpA
MRDLFRPFETATLDAMGRTAARIQEERGLPADVYEGDEEFLVLVDAPGAEPADVQTRYVDGRVEVRVDRFRAFHEGFELRYPGRGLSLSGEIPLPRDATVDPDGASATLGDDGTLRIRLPKIGE